MSETGMEENGQSVPQPAAGPGAQLSARRQELGWSIEQVANQLNLAPRQVQAMEDDNYAALPGIVIARGFVRAYAKLLKLDPTPLLAMISEKAAPSPESLELRRALSATFTESNLPTAKRSGNGKKWLALLLLVSVAGAAGWLAWREGLLPEFSLPGQAGMSAQPVERPAEGTAEAGSAEPMGQGGEAQSAPADAAASRTPDVPPAAAPSPAAPTTTAPVPASSAAPAQPAVVAAPTVSSSQNQAAAGKTTEKLVLKMREASWIEVKRADGSSVASRLVPAGATESLDVEAGARLVIGNASGVDATYRGQPLDLNADAKSNVARVTLK